jgi:WD40 repeat protein
LRSLPLAARVVEVLSDYGEGHSPRYRSGSGCLVAGRTVLTAAHVVAGAVSVLVRGPDKVAHQALLDPEFVGDADGPGPDLALLEVASGGHDVSAMGLAAVVRDSPAGDPVERCHVIGYPAFMERQAAGGGRFRETADAFGYVPVLSGLAGGLLSVQVSSCPRPLPPARVALGDSPWSGMSGGPVVADGLLLAVVTEHAPRAGSSAITATPLTALEADPVHPGWGPGVADPGAWWDRLGVADATKLKRLPVRRGQPERTYWATVREIRRRTQTLTGRQRELAAIASFAAGDEGYRWLAGEPYAGKTSLLAEAVLTLPEDVDVVCYFLSRREADADSVRFVAVVVPQLANLLGVDQPAGTLEQLRALWERAVERADAEDHHLLLVVDGLDEDLRPPGLASVAALLPATGGRAHVLVSSRPDWELPSDMPPGHPLADTRPVEVQPFGDAQHQAALARQEIDDLLRRDDDGLAADVLGLLTAAAGPLAVRDLSAMTTTGPQSPALERRIRRLLTSSAARSLQASRLRGDNRYQFAHESLLAYAQVDDDLNNPDFRHRVHQWAERWRAVGWPTPAGRQEGTPLYLLDTYPSTLTRDPWRLAELVSDTAWIDAAVRSVGVDHVLADLRRASAANLASAEIAEIAAVLAVVTGQAHNLRTPKPLDQPGYILRQLWMQAAELIEDDLAENLRSRLRSRPSPCLAPVWTTRRASRALSVELGGHDGSVWALGVLPDGRVVSGGGDGRIRVWDPAAPDGGSVEFGGHDGSVWALGVLPDGRVVSGGGDGRIRVWDPAAPDGGSVELGRHNGWVVAVVALTDGRVVSGGDDGRVLVWDPAAPDGGSVELGHHDAPVWALGVLPDGRVVSGGGDGRIRVWDPAAPDGGSVELGHHNGWVVALAVLLDGRVVSGEIFRLGVWDPAAPGTGPTELGRHEGSTHAVAVLPDGRVVSGGGDGRIRIWSLAMPGADLVEVGHHDGPVRAVAMLLDGRVASGGEDGRVLVWDPAAPGTGPVEPGHHDLRVMTVAVLPDGRVVTGSENGPVRIWDPAAPDSGLIELGRHDGPVWSVAVLPDGRVVSGDGKGRVRVWDPAAPEADPLEVGRHEGWMVAVATLGARRVVSGGEDGRVRVWDLAAPGAGPVELGHHDGPVSAIAVLDGDRVVSGGSDGRVLVWDPAAPGAGSVELGRHKGQVSAVAVLRGGRVIAGGEDGRVRVWDPAAVGTDPVELGRHEGSVSAVAVLSDERVASGSRTRDGQLRLWDVQRVTEIDRVSYSVTAIAVAPGPAEHELLLTAHEGQGLTMWSVRQPIEAERP